MIKIEIEVDVNKISSIGKYTLDGVMYSLDNAFSEFPILEADFNRRVYRDSGNVSTDYGIMGVTMVRLLECEWFRPYAQKVMWYNGDNVEDWLRED